MTFSRTIQAAKIGRAIQVKLTVKAQVDAANCYQYAVEALADGRKPAALRFQRMASELATEACGRLEVILTADRAIRAYSGESMPDSLIALSDFL